MIRYITRRLLFAVPTLIAISFAIFALLDLAPSDPTGQLPLTIPPEVRAQIASRSASTNRSSSATGNGWSSSSSTNR